MAAYAVLNEDDEDENQIDFRSEKRFLRDRYNVLDMSNKKFQESFRVSKEIFKYLLEEIASEPELGDHEIIRSTRVSVATKLAAVLNFYATGSYQRTIGDVMLHSMNQSMISKAIENITVCLERKICVKWITFPNEGDKRKYKEQFYSKTGFPGVFGCVDCTHVNIISPQDHEHLFVNRHGNHSLNVQLICNYDLKILAVNARYPGSTHDAAIWALSAEKRRLELDYEAGSRSWLLGDSGYPLQKWLITPFKNARTPEEHAFNHKHAKARNPIERCNGVIKNVFRCLLGSDRSLRYVPEKVIKIVNVCCALFNICIHFNSNFVDELNFEIGSEEHPESDEVYGDAELLSDDESAVDIRQNLLNTII